METTLTGYIGFRVQGLVSGLWFKADSGLGPTFYRPETHLSICNKACKDHKVQYL